MTLSKTQTEIIKLMREGAELRFSLNGMYFYIAGRRRYVMSVPVSLLERQRLIVIDKWVNSTLFTYTLTETGKNIEL